MSNLSERANYLKGLADGMRLNTEKSANRILMEVLDLLADMADEVERLRAEHDELSDYVDAVDEDLSQLEEEVEDLLPPPPYLLSGPDDDDDFFGDEEEDAADAGDDEEEDEEEDEGDGDDVEDDADDAEDAEDAEDKDEDVEPGEGEVAYRCPHCGKQILLTIDDSMDIDEDVACPSCGKPLFPEIDDEVEDDDFDDEE